VDARNSLDIADDDRTMIGTRMFDAPRELVFDAWTDPKHLAEWWGPDGFTTTTRSFAMQPGGVWRFVMHGPDGRDYQNLITYEEIVRPERIVYRHGGGDEIHPAGFSVRVNFEDLGGKTKLTMRMIFPTAAERDRIIKEYGADKGLTQTLARLETYVTARAKEAPAGGAPREFVISRTFAAPRALMWKAWSEADALAQWWGPKGAAIRVAKFDFRPGGVFHYAMQYKPGHDIWGRFVYREMVKPERLVFVNSFSDAEGGVTRAPFPQLGDKWPLEVLNTLTFTEAGGKTTLTLRSGPINATEDERKIFASMVESMRQGFGGTFDKLADYLAKS
jgi:uncharacterized protein YndB with AHSA1/START domain